MANGPTAKKIRARFFICRNILQFDYFLICKEMLAAGAFTKGARKCLHNIPEKEICLRHANTHAYHSPNV